MSIFLWPWPEELLKALSKNQLLKIAEHFEIEWPKQSQKYTLLDILKAHLVVQEVFPNVKQCSSETMPTVVTSSPEPPAKLVPPFGGFGATLTFEQQKELLLNLRDQPSSYVNLN